jgi:hypothetical protein
MQACAPAHAFDDVMKNVAELFQLPSLAPETVEKHTRLKLALAARSETFLPNYAGKTTYFVVEGFPGIIPTGSHLELEWVGMPAQNEWKVLYLSIAAPTTCISETELVARFGRPAERWVPTPSPHASSSARRGMTRLLLTYDTAQGLKTSFDFAHECARSIRVCEQYKYSQCGSLTRRPGR